MWVNTLPPPWSRCQDLECQIKRINSSLEGNSTKLRESQKEKQLNITKVGSQPPPSYWKIRTPIAKAIWGMIHIVKYLHSFREASVSASGPWHRLASCSTSQRCMILPMEMLIILAEMLILHDVAAFRLTTLLSLTQFPSSDFLKRSFPKVLRYHHPGRWILNDLKAGIWVILSIVQPGLQHRNRIQGTFSLAMLVSSSFISYMSICNLLASDL